MKEIRRQHIMNCKSKVQKHGVKLTENNTTYGTDDDDKTVEHRRYTSVAVKYISVTCS